MKRIVPILLLGLVGVAVTSCKEEKKPVDIVAKVPVEPKKPSGPQKREPFTTSEVVDWHGGKYTVKIERVPDSTLVSDASGQKYYDNRITLRILRADGSIFVDKTYRKSDFFAAVNNKFSTDGVLLGMAFDRVKDGQLAFGADNLSNIGTTGMLALRSRGRLRGGCGHLVEQCHAWRPPRNHGKQQDRHHARTGTEH